MGYRMEFRDSSVRIDHRHRPALLEALCDVGERHPHGREDLENIRRCRTVEEAFDAFSWAATANEAGDIIGLEFIGEKRDANEEMLEAVAPFLDDGSFIDLVGEHYEVLSCKKENGKPWVGYDGRQAY